LCFIGVAIFSAKLRRKFEMLGGEEIHLGGANAIVKDGSFRQHSNEKDAGSPDRSRTDGGKIGGRNMHSKILCL
jgi:hypothetical protein